MSTARLLIGLIILAAIATVFWHTTGNPAATPDTFDTSETTVSDGTIHFAIPRDLGLAITSEQILAKAYIPPCDEGFDYCLYYNGHAYDGTNFESAGVGIRKRLDLTSQEACLTTAPEGYERLHATTTEKSAYAMSLFAPLGDAGAGHYASGEEYRLYTAGKCYQFDTRIGETQFANYPEGSIEKFADTERESLAATLRDIVSGITLVDSDAQLTLPQ